MFAVSSDLILTIDNAAQSAALDQACHGCQPYGAAHTGR